MLWMGLLTDVAPCLVMSAAAEPVTPAEAAAAPALPLNLMLLSSTQSGTCGPASRSFLAAAKNQTSNCQL